VKVAALVLLVALVLGGLLGVLVSRDPGYVLIAYQGLAVETSLWLALLVLVGGYFLVRLGTFLFLRMGRGRGSFSGWNQRRRTRAARDQTVRGLLLMAECRWAEARKLLEGAAARAEAPLINYLNAARAAHELGDIRGRDELLGAARESAPGARFVVDLTQAELQRAEGQWELCLAALLQLHRQAPRHPQVLRLLVSCYQHLEDWQAVVELAGDLKKQRVMPEDALFALQRDAWRGRLAAGREDPQTLWKAVPRELQRSPALVADFTGALAAAERGADAEALVRAALDQSWDPELVKLYGSLKDADPERRLVVAEGWLKARPNDPDLLLALGRISLLNRLWAKAREYLEASLRLGRSTEAQSELGRLCTALGETERGAELLIQALQGLEALPVLPQPERADRAGVRSGL
jgi:HemY protein